MDLTALISMLTDGLPAEQAAVVRASIERDAVKAKVATLKDATEFEALNSRVAAMQQELEGDAATGKLGAKAYREWYDKNSKTIDATFAAVKKYEEKHGTGSFQKSLEGAAPTTTADPNSGRVYTEAEIDARVDKRIGDQYGPRWSTLLKSQSKILQKHMLSGRKNEIDMEQLADIANSKYNGNLELAYDEVDKPERDRIAKEATDKEVTRRVDEELAKRGASANFPGASDMTPSSLTTRSKADLDKFDRGNLVNELARSWNNPEAVQ